MHLFTEIAFGSLMLFLCSLVHVAAIVFGVSILRHMIKRPRGTALGIGLMTILGAHTIHIWSWAVVFQLIGAMPSFETGFYFAITTYTTLGYGDLILEPGLRIFATFASMTGLLAFGISTAFLVSLITRMLPRDWRS